MLVLLCLRRSSKIFKWQYAKESGSIKYLQWFDVAYIILYQYILHTYDKIPRGLQYQLPRFCLLPYHSMFGISTQNCMRPTRRTKAIDLFSQSSFLLKNTPNSRQCAIRFIRHHNVIRVLPLASSKDVRQDNPIHMTPNESAPSRIQTSYSPISPSSVSKHLLKRDYQYIPCEKAVMLSLFLLCSQKIKLPPGFNNFHTACITLFGSPTEHSTWILSTVSILPSSIPSFSSISLSSMPHANSLYLSPRFWLLAFATISSP